MESTTTLISNETTLVSNETTLVSNEAFFEGNDTNLVSNEFETTEPYTTVPPTTTTMVYACTEVSTEEHPCKWNTEDRYITADCSLRDLYNIPCGLPMNAYRLKLGYNRIEHLRMGELDNLPSLQKLELDNNPMKSIGQFL